jgi:hypothetical protein
MRTHRPEGFLEKLVVPLKPHRTARGACVGTFPLFFEKILPVEEKGAICDRDGYKTEFVPKNENAGHAVGVTCGRVVFIFISENLV